MSEFLANLIWLIHVAFILWFIITPFYNSPEMLVLHAMTGLTLFVHWWFNSDDCALTLLETKLRGVEKSESFFHSLVSPIYKFESDASLRKFIWLVSILFWSISVGKLIRNPDMIKEVFMKAWRGPSVKKVECGASQNQVVDSSGKRVLFDELPDVPSMKKVDVYYYKPSAMM